jgi:hypothetical protein
MERTVVERAREDVDFLRDLMARARQRVDPHAFHLVLWGAIVLVGYPLINWLQNEGRMTAMAVVGGIALLAGGVASALLEARLGGRGRVEGEDTGVGRAVGRIVAANVAAGMVLGALAPSTGFVAGPTVPILWGLVYASIAFHVGMLCSREYVWSGLAIFLGACGAMFVPLHAGYVLGPVMGLGMIVPGVIAERRVRLLQREDRESAVAGS